MIGRTLGHYRILEEIGKGGMGEVYRAHDERLERDVALKVLPAGTLADEAARKRFRKEALALSKLNHPTIATVFDFDTQDGVDFLVMEYIPGVTLSDKLASRGTGQAGRTLPEKEMIRLGLQLAEGLAAAHEQGVIHRDLKPGNLRVTPDGRLKILDFGLAKLVRPMSETASPRSLTETETRAGTPLYMAPEQHRGEKADARSDIYAAGLVLLQMATGELPVVRGQALSGKVSPRIEQIIGKCLEPDPELRYQSAKELTVDLRRLGARAPTRRLPRRALFAAAAALAVFVVLVGLNVGGLRDPLARLVGIGGSPRIESLAVLPLENLSGDPEQEYFADGMTEALITELSQIGALKVISRTSAMQYKGVKKPMPQIAQELGVDALVEGSVLREGDQVRVTVQLIHGPTDRHLWAESYQRELRGILALQSEVARAVAQEIQVKLTPQEQTRLARARPVNPEAYESYLRGRFYLDKRTPESLRKGLEHFQAAVDADPGYALGYVGLADTYRAFGSYGAMPSTEVYPRAKAALAKALEIDDTLAEAHVSLATSHYDDFDWQAAEREFQRALELNPNYSTAHHQYAVYLAASGRHEGAIKEIKRARELDPLSPVIRGAQLGILFHARKYDETIEEGEKALDGEPPFLYFHKGAAYIEKRMFDKGLAEFEQQAAVSPTPPVMARLGYAYARAGRRAEAVKIMGELEELSKRHYVSSYDIALVYAGLGDKAESLAWLERAYENKEGVMWLHFLRVSPCFDGLRGAPRFQALLRRMNFPE